MSKIKEKRWELLSGVQKGIEELLNEYDALQDTKEIDEVKILIDSLKRMKDIKEKITSQEEELKLRLLISSRERNVYLEKLRKIEEYGEDKEWKDEDGFLSQISEILYSDSLPKDEK